jgi:hypothetical protein
MLDKRKANELSFIRKSESVDEWLSALSLHCDLFSGNLTSSCNNQAWAVGLG